MAVRSAGFWVILPPVSLINKPTFSFTGTGNSFVLSEIKAKQRFGDLCRIDFVLATSYVAGTNTHIHGEPRREPPSNPVSRDIMCH